MATFVFYYSEIEVPTVVPTILVRSIRACNASATVIQCSDAAAAQIEGVDECRRFDVDPGTLMTARLRSFAQLGLEAPAIYVDTDMICVRPVEPAAVLGDHDVAVCRRELQKNVIMQFRDNTTFADLRFEELDGKRLDDVFPFVACATVTKNADFWSDCVSELGKLDPKYGRWYGDQAAIRRLVESGRYRVRQIPESVYGCIPDAKSPSSQAPRLLHFKGVRRKAMMMEWARRNGLI